MKMNTFGGGNNSGSEQRPVLLVAYHFPPSGAVGGRRMRRFYEYLPAHGFRPVVLTIREELGESLDPSCPHRYRLPADDIVRSGVLPSFNDGYRCLKQANPFKRSGPGCERWPAPGVEAGDVGRRPFWRRFLLALMQTPDETFSAWYLPAVLRGRRIIRDDGIRCMVTSSPPCTAHIVGLTLKKLTGVRWIADFRDPWVGSPQRDPATRTALTDRFDRAMERWTVEQSDHVVSVTERMTHLLRQRYPRLDPRRFVTIPNAADPDDLDGVSMETDTGRFTLVYAGALYGGRDPGGLFSALGKFLEATGLDRSAVRLRFIGAPSSTMRLALEDKARLSRVGDVVSVEGRLPRREVLEISGRSHGLVVLAQNQPDQIPGKVYEIAALMKPILALTEDGATADVLREAGGAWVVDPGDIDGISQAIREIYLSAREGLTSEARDQRRAFIHAYDPVMLTGKLAELLRSPHGEAGSDRRAAENAGTRAGAGSNPPLPVDHREVR